MYPVQFILGIGRPCIPSIFPEEGKQQHWCYGLSWQLETGSGRLVSQQLLLEAFLAGLHWLNLRTLHTACSESRLSPVLGHQVSVGP